MNQKNELEYHRRYFDIPNNDNTLKEYLNWSIDDLRKLFQFEAINENSNCFQGARTKIFTKAFNEIKTTFSSSSINTISCFLDCLSYINIGNISVGEVFSYIFILFDYYIIAALNLFASQDTINSLLTKKVYLHNNHYASLEDANKQVHFMKRYLTLISFIKSTINKLEKMLKITISLGDHGKSNKEQENRLFPTLTSEIYLDGCNPYCCLIETIICFETMITLKKFIGRTSYISQYAFGLKQIDSYEEILKQVSELLYIPLCNNIFQDKRMISQMMITQNWDVIESDVQSKFNDASLFIYNILDDTFEKFNNLTILSSDTLSECSKQRFFRCVIVHLVDSLMEVIAEIDQWSSIGRSILLNDSKILKNNIQEIINSNGKKKDNDDLFNMLIMYISAWYYNSNELVKYIASKVSLNMYYIMII